MASASREAISITLTEHPVDSGINIDRKVYCCLLRLLIASCQSKKKSDWNNPLESWGFQYLPHDGNYRLGCHNKVLGVCAVETAI